MNIGIARDALEDDPSVGKEALPPAEAPQPPMASTYRAVPLPERRGEVVGFTPAERPAPAYAPRPKVPVACAVTPAERPVRPPPAGTETVPVTPIEAPGEMNERLMLTPRLN